MKNLLDDSFKGTEEKKEDKKVHEFKITDEEPSGTVEKIIKVINDAVADKKLSFEEANELFKKYTEKEKGNQMFLFPELSEAEKEISDNSARVVKNQTTDIIPRTLAEDMRYIPAKLLIENFKAEPLSDGKIVVSYNYLYGSTPVRIMFLLEGIKIEELKAGGRLKKCLTLIHQSAIEQKTDSPIIKRELLTKLLGKQDVDNIIISLKSGSYFIDNKQKGLKSYREYGNFIENVKFHGKGKGSHIEAQIRKKDRGIIENKAVGIGKRTEYVENPESYIVIPSSNRKKKYSNLVENIYTFFLLYVKGYEKKGGGAYPRIIIKFLINELGKEQKDIRVHGPKYIRKILEGALKELENEIGYLYSSQIGKDNQIKNYLDWKIRLFCKEPEIATPKHLSFEGNKIIEQAKTDRENKKAFLTLPEEEKEVYRNKAVTWFESQNIDKNLVTKTAISAKAREFYTEYLSTL